MNLFRSIGTTLALAALAACSTTTVSETAGANQTSLEGTNWRLVAADSGPLASLEGARKVTMGFAEGRVFGHAGCNRYFGTYTADDGQLALAHVGATKMYCEGEGSLVEQAFLPLLQNPLTLQRGAVLQLQAADGTTLHFEPAPQPR